LVLAASLLLSGVTQETGVLRVTITLPDAAQAPVPVAGHALLISDNPPTRTPRRVVTAADGSIRVTLAPGSYIVESDRPVGFLGQAFQWTSTADVIAGRETTLALTAQNAEIQSAVAAAATSPDAANPTPDVASLLRQWQASVVTVWSPTNLASGLVVDASGLIATDRHAVGRAMDVEIQVSPSLKVTGRVLVAESTQDVAIVWVDPGVFESASSFPVVCPPAATPPLKDGDEIIALTVSRGGTADFTSGEITSFHPRGMDTDLRLSFGEAGGPVFAGHDQTLVGLAALSADAATSGRSGVRVVRAGVLCEAVSAARAKAAATAPPAPTRLPIEPQRPYPTESTTAKPSTPGAAQPVVVTSPNFDVAFITPPAVLRARERADWTGGRSGRTPEAEARLGRLTDFGSWSEYFAGVPALLIVRVTPRLAEGFWMRVAREAARTQGADLPAFKDFKTNFLRMTATCGGAEVTPIHPFVIEHPLDKTRVVREGLYVFSADAFGPHCSSVTLVLSSEQTPEKPDTLVITSATVARIWQDFAPYRQ
jgi:hypothetical protein